MVCLWLSNMDENTLKDDSLEGPEIASSPTITPDKNNKPVKKKKFLEVVKNIASRLNIYLLLFILILVLSSFVVFLGLERSKKELSQSTIITTPLTQDALDKIKGSDTKIGDSKQTLSIESNAIFSGGVLIKGGLDVAGTIKVGGDLSLPNIIVSGVGSFDQTNTNNLAVSGNSGLQGNVNVQGTLTVAGSAQFGGPVSVPQLTVRSLVLEGDLTISRHIDAGGGTPGKSDGTALGSGGSSSISGTDTAGTLTVNTGGSPSVGCFATINFAIRFNATPHVVITPIGSASAGLNYYINRSANNFSICTTTAAPSGSNFSFDWIVID